MFKGAIVFLPSKTILIQWDIFPYEWNVPNGFEATEANDTKAMVDKGVDAIKEDVAVYKDIVNSYLLSETNHKYSHL